MSKFRYIEKFPMQLDLSFENRISYNEFYNRRLRQIIDSDLQFDKWDKKTIPLNKDGSPRKYNPATHLNLKENREKQKEKFKEYLETKKIEKIERDNQIRQNYENALKILINNNIDITKLKISPKFPNF